MKNHLLFVIYDGIENSVFQSQVRIPIEKMLSEDSSLQIILISFERTRPKEIGLNELKTIERLQVKIFKKYSLVSMFSLIPLIHSLSSFLSLCGRDPGSKSRMTSGDTDIKSCGIEAKFWEKKNDKIVARGPVAGLITQKALLQANINKKIDFVVQARGLLAEEYRYAFNFSEKKSFFQKLLFKYRYRLFEKIEKEVFEEAKNDYFDKKIMTVSPALKSYLEKFYDADPRKTSVSYFDVTKKIPHDKILAWRNVARRELKISNEATVFVYSGSYKPWQCVEESIDLFCKKYSEDRRFFLLVLSQDYILIEKLIQEQDLSTISYRCFSAESLKLFYYLSAADYGLLMRKKDIVNWVSRPTKMLEYQAVGLKIIHNDTIEWLAREKVSNTLKKEVV
jgi:hypothetical protein